MRPAVHCRRVALLPNDGHSLLNRHAFRPQLPAVVRIAVLHNQLTVTGDGHLGRAWHADNAKNPAACHFCWNITAARSVPQAQSNGAFARGEPLC